MICTQMHIESKSKKIVNKKSKRYNKNQNVNYKHVASSIKSSSDNG